MTWPRSMAISLGISTPNQSFKAMMKSSVAFRPIGSLSGIPVTPHFSWRRSAAAFEANAPRARVTSELPESRISAMVAPPSGYIWYLLVSGASRTPDVSGNMIEFYPERIDDPPDLAHVAGVYKTRDDIDLLFLGLAFRLCQVRDHRFAHVGETR